MKINKQYQANFDKLSDFEKEEISNLKNFLEKGKEPTIVLLKVRNNGMSRTMAFLYTNNKGEIKRFDAELIKKIKGEKSSKKYDPNFTIIGHGTDVAFALLQSIKIALGVKNKSQGRQFISLSY